MRKPVDTLQMPFQGRGAPVASYQSFSWRSAAYVSAEELLNEQHSEIMFSTTELQTIAVQSSSDSCTGMEGMYK